MQSPIYKYVCVCVYVYVCVHNNIINTHVINCSQSYILIMQPSFFTQYGKKSLGRFKFYIFLRISRKIFYEIFRIFRNVSMKMKDESCMSHRLLNAFNHKGDCETFGLFECLYIEIYVVYNYNYCKYSMLLIV